MDKEKSLSEKLAIGLFVEGQYLHVACLSLKKNRVKLVDAQILKLSKTLENVKVQEEVLTEVLNDYSDEENAPIDVTEEIPEEHWINNDKTSDARDNVEVLRHLLRTYSNRKNKLAISLSEPQIYYSYYATDWGLEGKKLKQKVLEELQNERGGGEKIQPDALQIVRLKDGRLMGILRDNEVNVLNLLEYLHHERTTRIPVISFVESSESALVNLVNANYEFGENEITVIVYLGNEFSRLIFLKGNQIYTISYIIGAGLDSENITNTIYSRILLEQDNLNLPQIQNIILTGEAYEVSLKSFLEGQLPTEINVDYIKMGNLDVIGTEPLISRFAVAIGSAWRILHEGKEFVYDINLLPAQIEEGQKKFKLGFAGTILLFLLPAIAFFSTLKIGEQRRLITQLETQQTFHQQELVHLQEIETKVNAKKEKLINYQNAFGVVDEMSAGLKTWSSFLNRLSKESKRIGYIWITDVNQRSADRATLKGYSVYRNRIPQLSGSIGSGALKKVEFQEIRNRTVYYFEMDADLPKTE